MDNHGKNLNLKNTGLCYLTLKIIIFGLILGLFSCKQMPKRNSQQQLTSVLEVNVRKCLLVDSQHKDFDKFWAPVTQICIEKMENKGELHFLLYEEEDLVQEYFLMEKYLPTNCKKCRYFSSGDISINWSPEDKNSSQKIKLKDEEGKYLFLMRSEEKKK
jgi:hypothetical protein